MSPALQAVEAIYFNTQQRLNDMLAACPTDDDRVRVRTQYVLTRHNYFVCINKSFHDDDPELESIVADAQGAAVEIKVINLHLGDITKVIDTLTMAVAYGSQIVAKIITL